MKKCSAANPPKALKRPAAVNFALLNQLAAPGLGSLLAGRRWTGLSQLILALAGVGLVMAWFVQVCLALYRELQQLPSETTPVGGLGAAGAVAFIVAWLWSGITSIGFFRTSVDSGEPPPANPTAR